MTSIPKKIGKYQIISILGKGGMGIVYKAVNPDISQQVALKVIHPELLEIDVDSTFLNRFRNEAKACRLLNHPNIIAIYDYLEVGNECYIVMEYIEGQKLSSYLEKKAAFNFNVIYKIIKQLLSMLNYAHEQGVIHRDIKPDNILIKGDGTIHVLDFGIAKLEASTLPVAGTVMGSPSYMSPEQCQGIQIDNRCDLFSVGVVVYQLITNEKPFMGDNPMSTMQKILSVDPVNPSLLNNNIPSSFDLVINKALAKIPKNRYQTANEFMQDIDAFYMHYLESQEKSKKKRTDDSTYIYVDYFTSNGDVIHLYSTSDLENNLIEESNSFVLGNKYLQWEIAKPYGTDLIAIPTPLFEPIRPNVDNTNEHIKLTPYITELRSSKKSLKTDCLF